MFLHRLDAAPAQPQAVLRLSSTLGQRFTETLAVMRPLDDRCYQTLDADQLLAVVADAVKSINAARDHTNVELRRRLLPALIVLKQKLKGRQPGFYAALRRIGLNPATVRVWFHRGRIADETIRLLGGEDPEQPSPPDPHVPDPLDENQHLLRHADKLAAAVLKGKTDWAHRLAAEYANVRVIGEKSNDRWSVRQFLMHEHGLKPAAN